MLQAIGAVTVAVVSTSDWDGVRDKRLGTGGRACVLGGVDGGYPSKFNFHKKGMLGPVISVVW